MDMQDPQHVDSGSIISDSATCITNISDGVGASARVGGVSSDSKDPNNVSDGARDDSSTPITNVTSYDITNINNNMNNTVEQNIIMIIIYHNMNNWINNKNKNVHLKSLINFHAHLILSYNAVTSKKKRSKPDNSNNSNNSKNSNNSFNPSNVYVFGVAVDRFVPRFGFNPTFDTFQSQQQP